MFATSSFVRRFEACLEDCAVGCEGLTVQEAFQHARFAQITRCVPVFEAFLAQIRAISIAIPAAWQQSNEKLNACAVEPQFLWMSTIHGHVHFRNGDTSFLITQMGRQTSEALMEVANVVSHGHGRFQAATVQRRISDTQRCCAYQILAALLTCNDLSSPRAAAGFTTQHVSPDNRLPLSPNMSAVEDSAATSSEARGHSILHPGLATTAPDMLLDSIAEDDEAAGPAGPELPQTKH